MDKTGEEIPPNISKKALGIRLLNSVKDKNFKVATSLLQHEPDMTVKDPAGWKALHFAALEGNVEMIELLLKSGAVVECWDNNGQSPLHKAARRGHIDAVVSLVTHGAAFPIDWKGQTPLELAVIEKLIDMVQVLCLFGASVPPDDRIYITEDKSAKMKQIKEVLQTQRALLPDFEYKKIIWNIQKIEMDETEMTELDLTVNSRDLSKPFYLYVARKTEFKEFIDYVNVFREEHILFSDLYEFHVWRTTERIIDLRIKVDGVPGLLHDLVIISQEPSAARISSFNIENQQTIVSVALTIRQMKKVTFALLLREKQPEVFQVSKESKVIIPEAEPEAEICIPEGTFEEPTELQVEFLETKYVNEEETDGPILLTNVLDVTLSEGSSMTSGKELTMKLPIHESNEGPKNDVCVLVTSEEFPESSDDWEVIEAQDNSETGSAVFTISHLSLFVGASKLKVRKNKDEVVDAAKRCLGNKCLAVFIGYTRLEDDNALTIVIECSTPKKSIKRAEKWEKKGFKELFSTTEKFLISRTEILKLDIQLGTNLKDPSGSLSNSLQFNDTKQNYLIKELHIIDKTVDINGEVQIDIEERSEIELPDAGCIFVKKKKNQPKKTTTKIEYNYLTKIKFNFSKANILKALATKSEKSASNRTPGVSQSSEVKTFQDPDTDTALANKSQKAAPFKTNEVSYEPNINASETVKSETDTDKIKALAAKSEKSASNRTPGVSQSSEVNTLQDPDTDTALANKSQKAAPFKTNEVSDEPNINASETVKSETDTDKNTIPALQWSSLKELASALSEEEAEHIAIQLELKRRDVEELQNTFNKQYGMAFLVFKHWRNSTQSITRIKKLQEALIAIGRQDLAIAFKQAHLDDVPFRKDDIVIKRIFRS